MRQFILRTTTILFTLGMVSYATSAEHHYGYQRSPQGGHRPHDSGHHGHLGHEHQHDQHRGGRPRPGPMNEPRRYSRHGR